MEKRMYNINEKKNYTIISKTINKEGNIGQFKDGKKMNLLEIKMQGFREWIVNTLFYKVEAKLEVIVKREGSEYKYDVRYHEGNINFPFEYSSKIAEAFQEQAKKLLENYKEDKEIWISETYTHYIFKPKILIPKYLNRLIDELK